MSRTPKQIAQLKRVQELNRQRRAEEAAKREAEILEKSRILAEQRRAEAPTQVKPSEPKKSKLSPARQLQLARLHELNRARAAAKKQLTPQQKRFKKEFEESTKRGETGFYEVSEKKTKDKPKMTLLTGKGSGSGYDFEFKKNQLDTIAKRLNSTIPTKYPFLIQATIDLYAVRLIQDGNKRITQANNEKIKESRATAIASASDREKYINSLINRAFDYHMTVELAAAAINDITFKVYTDQGPQPLINVARYSIGNCLINIIKNTVDVDLDKIYAKIPQLRPTAETPNPYITQSQIKILAKMLKCRFTIYSKLGEKIQKPWEVIGLAQGRQYKIVFTDSHARLMPNSVIPNTIIYQDQEELNLFNQDQPNIVDFRIDEICTTCKKSPCEVKEHSIYRKTIFYTTVSTDGTLTMYKSFRPSSITNKPEDDDKYPYVFDVSQMLTKIFREKYDLTPIKRNLIRNVVKASEHFIGRRMLDKVTNNTYQLDMAACYASYKSNPYYMGFPNKKLYPTAETHDSLFYMISNISDAPESFKTLLQYSSGPIVLTAPVVKYLRDCNAKLDVVYTLVGTTQDIDINSFIESQKSNINAEDIKLFRNSLIGRCIAGGISETKKVHCVYSTIQELNQLIHEAIKANYTFSVNEETRTISIDYEIIPSGAFHFHSYILGYAFISVCSMMEKMRKQEFKIVGYNVDAIFFNSTFSTAESYFTTITTTSRTTTYEPIHYHLNQKWSLLGIKNFYKLFPVNPSDPQPYEMREKYLLQNLARELPRDTVIDGAAGISKSYPFVTNPYYDQIILTPTHTLKREHAETQKSKNIKPRVETAHKYFQFSMNDEKYEVARRIGQIPQPRSVIIVDEKNMFSTHQWDIMISRARKDKSIIIAIGDSQQIANSIDSTPISLNYFISNNFKLKTLTRTPDGPARQSFADGTILDSLRTVHHSRQVQQLLPHVKSITADEFMAIITNKITYITDNHKSANSVNLTYKKYCIDNKLSVDCKDAKSKLSKRSPSDPKIWWDKIKMGDIPQGYLYEPTFAQTADSTQGKSITGPIYVDGNIQRPGAFYTAVTRCRTLDQIIIVVNQKPKIDAPKPADPDDLLAAFA